MTETANTAFEGYCEIHRLDQPCEECDAEDRLFEFLRVSAARLVAGADEAECLLTSLDVLLGEVTSLFLYKEFRSLTMDDEDAAAFLAEARRAIRSFTRIARERAARTRQDP